MAEINPLLGSVRNILNIPDLRKRIFFMLLLLAVYRVGSWIPTPGVDSSALQEVFRQQAGTIFGILDIFSGGNLSRLSVFALGITPYITASIILQLLTVVWPYLERLSKEGELGRKKITQYTRYLTVALSLFQSLATALALERTSSTPPVVPYPGLGLPSHDNAHADHRHRFRHVARRTDLRARNRKRHLPDHLRRNRRRTPEGRSFTLAGLGRWRAEHFHDLHSAHHDGGGRRGHCLRGEGAKANPDPVRQAGRRPTDVRWSIDPSCH